MQPDIHLIAPRPAVPHRELLHAIDRRTQYAGKNACRGVTGHDDPGGVADMTLHHGRRYDLSHFSLDLPGGPFLFVGVRRRSRPTPLRNMVRGSPVQRRLFKAAEFRCR